jgi:hypothetical protein
MANYPYNVPPAAGLTIGSPAELEELVSKAMPGTNISYNWYSNTAPDKTTYPEMVRMVWIDTSGAKPVKRTYNAGTSSWEAELPAAGSITNDMLAGGITTDKFALTGGSAGYVYRINTAGTAVVFDSPVNLFSAAGFRMPVTAISLPGAAGVWVAYSDGTATAWASLATLVGAITINLGQINTATAAEGKALSYVGGALGYNYVEALQRDNETLVTKLKATGADLFFMTNAAGTASELRDAAAVAALVKSSVVKTFTSGGSDTLPAKGGLLTVAHTLTVKPTLIQIRLVCSTADAGYAVGDDPLLDSFSLTDGAADDRNAIFSIYSDASSIYLRRDDNASLSITVPAKASGTATTITEASWRVKVTAIYFP